MSGYEWIKRLKKATGRNIPDLVALDPDNDPFSAGSKSHVERAEWFAEIYYRLGFDRTPGGAHLRAIHYRLISQDPPLPYYNGEPYQNTATHWAGLALAGKYARYLGLVDMTAFIDRRNPPPQIYVEPVGDVGWFHDFDQPDRAWELPEIAVDLSVEFPMPDLFPTGYDYDDALQAYHVEAWCEKSTMDGYLLPVCEEHGVNYVTGIGELSITSVVNLLNRVRALGKPCKILYLSDHDPAGTGMPVSVARKIEFLTESAPEFAEISLHPLLLTGEQVRSYNLPRTPIKDTELRKKSWEQINSEGAVELDALEALHPGESPGFSGGPSSATEIPSSHKRSWRPTATPAAP